MVRGKRFERVISNIHNFLEAIEESEWKPRVLVQIINLKEINEIYSQIEAFKKYWQNYDVELAVWDKLNWGVFDNDSDFKFRYPCYSLWESFNINSNNIVTACCMDWKQELVFGNVSEQSIEDIWKGKEIDTLRKIHIEGKEDEVPACKKCNYWFWQPRLMNYFLISILMSSYYEQEIHQYYFFLNYRIGLIYLNRIMVFWFFSF
jgi:radical SAM protein with 4Fe4S-binding SPASM domain